jgi:ribosomal protein S18 acetylase RimI-like enzyme
MGTLLFSAKDRPYQFPVKEQKFEGEIELVLDPNQIDHGAARSILVESFITEYRQYLSPEQVDKDCDSWRDGEHSVQKYYEKYYEEELAAFTNGTLHYWVQAKIKGQLVGWATFEREHSDPDAVYMNLLIVDPNLQKRGIGRELVNALMNLHVIPDLTAINLLIRKKNQAGRKFYCDNMGFKLNPDYKRPNFVDVTLLEGLTWNNPALKDKVIKKISNK